MINITELTFDHILGGKEYNKDNNIKNKISKRKDFWYFESTELTFDQTKHIENELT
jgi:uncharacterized protein YneR